MEHTPGPWHWSDDGEGNKWGSRGLEPAVISGTVEALVSVDAADARLIAASPDLLEALIMALPYVETALEDQGYKPGAVDRMCSNIRAAIAKATGETAT
jgi:hypothetical protein